MLPKKLEGVQWRWLGPHQGKRPRVLSSAGPTAVCTYIGQNVCMLKSGEFWQAGDVFSIHGETRSQRLWRLDTGHFLRKDKEGVTWTLSQGPQRELVQDGFAEGVSEPSLDGVQTCWGLQSELAHEDEYDDCKSAELPSNDQEMHCEEEGEEEMHCEKEDEGFATEEAWKLEDDLSSGALEGTQQQRTGSGYIGQNVRMLKSGKFWQVGDVFSIHGETSSQRLWTLDTGYFVRKDKEGMTWELSH